MATALLPLEQPVTETRLERSIWYMGALLTILVDSKQTNGAFALFEANGRPGGEPPLHVHHNEHELFYVIEGRLAVTRGDEQLVLEAGQAAFLPRMIPHTFRVISEKARILTYVTPGGFEDYFRTMGRTAEQLTWDPNPPAPDFARMAKVAGEFGVAFLNSRDRQLSDPNLRAGALYCHWPRVTSESSEPGNYA
jgi:mannose-6-phosphate isomerase-like protein (cupin superfamily)